MLPLKRCPCCKEEKIRPVHFSPTATYCADCTREKKKISRKKAGMERKNQWGTFYFGKKGPKKTSVGAA